MPKPKPWYASLNQPPRSPKDGRNRRTTTPAHSRPVDRTDPTVDPGSSDTTAVVTFIPGVTFIYPLPESQPPTIPYAGVRAGELIGHRAWLILKDNQLCSLAHHFIWEPGAVIEGDLDKPVSGCNWLRPIFGGTYSYKEQSHLDIEFGMFKDDDFPCIIEFSTRPFPIVGIAFGTIKCWGEVSEHEKGYRAQYAKLHTIDRVIGDRIDITSLRERYKL